MNVTQLDCKNLFLRGIFETKRTEGEKNAITQYFDFMYSDDEIEIIEKDPLLQAELGIFRKGYDSMKDWTTRLAVMKQQMHLVRSDAAFYLALCHYENGSPSTALNWLNQIGQFDDLNRWVPYTPYQLGRCNEALGDYSEAAKNYAIDKSPQKHGSLIRKRWMDSLIKASQTRP